MNLTCCYTSEHYTIRGEIYTCDNRRLPDLPMCQRHMHQAFRAALYANTLPDDVWRDLVSRTEVIASLRERYWNASLDHEIYLDRRAREQATQAEREAATHVVYYVALRGDRIKIGTTTKLVRRLSEMRVRDEDVLAIEPGGRVLELERHHQFAHLRIGRSEEFRRAPDLEDHIARTGFMLAS